MSGKVFLITGATAGLGASRTSSPTEAGNVVVMLCRDSRRGEIARHRIEARAKKGAVHLLVADLSDPRSVWGAAAEFIRTFGQLDVLVNNAAVFTPRRTLTQGGLELMFATNYLGHFVLTNLLVGVLSQSDAARIVNVVGPTTAELKFGDLQGEVGFDALHAYNASKMANLLFTFELAKRLSQTTIAVNAVNPGTMRTNLFKDRPFAGRFMAGLTAKPPDAAARGPLFVACSPAVGGLTGQLFEDQKAVVPAPYALREDVQERLWEDSLRLVDLEKLLLRLGKEPAFKATN